jgi:hypothetical protein
MRKNNFFVIYRTDICVFNILREVHAFLKTVNITMHLLPWPIYRISYFGPGYLWHS